MKDFNFWYPFQCIGGIQKLDVSSKQAKKIGEWNWPLVGAIVLTIGYFAGAYFLFSESQVCDGKLEGIFAPYFSCRSLNEIGDFLAGLFAPVAFIWLAVAVFVQSRELSLQRKELQLTRVEFTETREVNRAQAEEARRQAEYIGRQTEILEQERVQREKDQADRDIDLSFNSLKFALKSDIASLSINVGDGTRQYFNFPDSELIHEYVDSVINHISGNLKYIRTCKSNGSRVLVFNFREFRNVRQAITDINKFEQKISYAKKLTLNLVNLNQLSAECSALEAFLEQELQLGD